MSTLGYGPGSLRSFYDRAPVAVQNMLTTAYGYRHAHLAYGRAYRRHYARIERTQWLGRRELEKLQLEELRLFLRTANDTSRYWKRIFAEYRFDPASFRSLEQLGALPALDKDTLRQVREDLVPQAARDGTWPTVEARTSGTTGKALRVTLTRDVWVREYAFLWLYRSWGGVRRGDRIATIAGHPVVPGDQARPPFWRYNAAERQVLFSSRHIGPSTVESYVRQLRHFRPALIHGFPSAIALLARYLEADAGVPIHPRAIQTHSETLHDEQREVIERAFGCKVYDRYGSVEQVGHIVECERGSLHVMHNYSLLEFVHPDGTPARPGETCEIWATAFANPAMPLIRYRTGDGAILADGECSCGRAGQLVDRILGRDDDYIVTPDGRHLARLAQVFSATDRVYEAQLVQEELDTLDVLIVPLDGFDDRDRMAIEAAIRERLGSSITLRFRLVAEIPRGPNGKYRFTISRVPVAIGAGQR